MTAASQFNRPTADVPESGANAGPASQLYPNAANERVRSIWTSGDFGRIATGYTSGAADFVARLSLIPGEHVLDVACGTGNLALPAARAGAKVAGVDIAPNLVAQAAANAEAEELDATFQVGDAESLPYEDGDFDVVMSMFGVMFAAHAPLATSELLRVTRRGGRIALATWTASGFIGQMLGIITAFVPPPADAIPVLAWGDEKTVRERLTGVSSVHCVRRRIALEYPLTPALTVRLFREYYGPTVRAFATLNFDRGLLLERALTAHWAEHNKSLDGSTRVESEYLEVIAVR
ncbi:MAG: class I SAM-dependent methyltransferase [Gemmatimonas sp.]